ncbi:hypothetical protein HW555_013385 [Spodoptera exigua]|uniref:Uncharacterized protein n=1 Tax=Spodoptera exigua TaxID=7107 RepID=A0A835G1S6_SPOEX|nr:hypothetical protein HW555_013385 [Spodoptera exigua]
MSHSHYKVNDDIYGKILKSNKSSSPSKMQYEEVYEAVGGLDALLADLQNSINPGARVGSPGGRSSPGGRTASPGRTSSPLGRGSSPGRLSSPGGSLNSPSSTGYGSINGSRNISSDYTKPASPTYQNTSSLHEKVHPIKYNTTQASYGNHNAYNAGQPAYNTAQPAYGRTASDRSGRGHLTELDTLLDDLSNARYGNYVDKTTYNERNELYASNELILFSSPHLSSQS